MSVETAIPGKKYPPLTADLGAPYQKLHDNLINCLIYNARRYQDGAKEKAKERVYELRTEGNENLDKAAQLLRLYTDGAIPQLTPFHEVQAKAFRILEAHKIDFVADHLTKAVKFDETAFQWEHLDDVALQFKRHLRPIVQRVDGVVYQNPTPDERADASQDNA